MALVEAIPEDLDLEIYAGDTFRIRLDFHTPAGNAQDLTGDILAQVRVRPGDPVITSFSVDSTNAISGYIFITLDTDQTRLLGNTIPGIFRYDVEFTDPNSNHVTLIAGTITMIQDISRV